MNHHLVNIALIFFLSAVFSSVVSVFILKVRFIGSFWGALALALVGAFMGGALGASLPVIFNRVIQLFVPSILLSFLFLYFFKWLSVLQEY